MFTLVLLIAFVVIFAGLFQRLYMYVSHILRTMSRSVSVYCFFFPLACTSAQCFVLASLFCVALLITIVSISQRVACVILRARRKIRI